MQIVVCVCLVSNPIPWQNIQSLYAVVSTDLAVASRWSYAFVHEIKSNVVSQGQSRLELYDWKQVARFLRPH